MLTNMYSLLLFFYVDMAVNLNPIPTG